jgi:hypothetical protein
MVKTRAFFNEPCPCRHSPLAAIRPTNFGSYNFEHNLWVFYLSPQE